MSTSTAAKFPLSTHAVGAPPADLAPIVKWFESRRDARERFRWALRDSMDELLDGQRTGRWAYDHLSKTEKTHLGTVVEVNLTKEFEIPNGVELDWQVTRADLDCKFSKDLGGWEIPMEMYLCQDHGPRSGSADHPALLVWMNDDTSEWAAGVLQTTDLGLRWLADGVTRAYNRDNKRRLAALSNTQIYWLWGGIHGDLPANVIRQLSSSERDHIFAVRSGQERVDRLFCTVQQRLVTRAVVLTVAQQEDAPKRARDARLRLRGRGIVVLGHQENHPLVADALGLERPQKGEWISVRVVRVEEDSPRARLWVGAYEDKKVRSAEGWWGVALEDEPEGPGPVLTSKVQVHGRQ